MLEGGHQRKKYLDSNYYDGTVMHEENIATDREAWSSTSLVTRHSDYSLMMMMMMMMMIYHNRTVYY